MSLKEEIKAAATDKRPVHRANIFAAHAFLVSHPFIALLYAAIFVGASVASALGFLKWQEVFMRWSFAALMILCACYALACFFKGRRG